MVELSVIIKRLIAERNRLNDAIEALQGIGSKERRGGKRHLSAAGRAKIVAAQRKRWAKVKRHKKGA